MKRNPFILIFSVLMMFAITFPAIAQDDDSDDMPVEYTQLVADSGLSLHYPSEWTFEIGEDSSSTILLFSNESIPVRETDAPFASGDISLMLSFFPSDYAHLFGFSGETHEAILATLVNGLTLIHTDDDGITQFTADDIEVMTATDDQPEITLVRYSLADTADGMWLLWDVSDEVFVSAIVSTATDELADQEALIMEIITSITYDSTMDGGTN